MSIGRAQRARSVKRFTEPLHQVWTAPLSTPSTLGAVAQAPHHDPRAGGVHGPLAGRRELRAARHAGVGRDRAARARGRRGARLRGRPDRARARRRRDRGRRPARRQPRRLLEPGARARRPARALRRRAQHAGGRRRRRARPRARARRSGSSTSASTASSSCRSGPASGGWAAIARQVATVTIGDALPGVAPAGEVVFDNERGVQQSLAAPQRARPPPHHRALLGGRDLARPRGGARGRGHRRRRSGSTAASSPAPTRSTARARSRSSCSPATTARPRSCACPTRSPTASTPRARSSELSIPGDVAVAGFGDHPISRLLSPPLTSTVWDVEQVAERATELPARGDRPPTARRRRCARSSRRCSSTRPSTG